MPTIERPIRREVWAEVTECNGIARQSGRANVEHTGLWESTLQAILGLRDLDNDWDGFGAEAPPLEVLESAIGLAHCLRDDGVVPPHRVAPGVCGTVILEWQDQDGTYTEVEIIRPLHAEVMVVEPGQSPKQWTIPTE
jgi:hypothetical protein